MIKLSILDIVGPYGASYEAGEKVYVQIYPKIKSGEPVQLDFAGVKAVSSSFFNAAIVRLYKVFDATQLKQTLFFDNFKQGDRFVLDRTLQAFFSNKTQIPA